MWFVVFLALLAAPFVVERQRAKMDGRARTQAPGEFLPLQDGLTHVRWTGPKNGPVVVCVHGLTTPSFVWGPIVEGLNQMGYRVLRYDLYGRGYSDRPRGKQNRAFFLRQLEGVLNGMGVTQPFILAGYSMGGSIATAFAVEYPERISHLLLIAPAGLALNEGPLDRNMTALPVLGEWFAYGIGTLLFRRSLKVQELTPSAVPDVTHRVEDETRYRGYAPAVLSSRRHMLREPQFADHQELEMEEIPTLAVWGHEDDVIPLRGMGMLAQANREAQQVMIKGAGHSLPLTHAREVMEAIRGFLSRF